MKNNIYPLAALGFALSVSLPAYGQSILIPHRSQNGGAHVAAFSAVDGSMQTASFINLSDQSAPVLGPTKAIRLNGDYWVTDRVSESVHQWSPFGVDYLGEQLTGFGDLYGGVEAAGSTWFCQYTPGGGVTGSLLEVEPGGAVTQHPLAANPRSAVLVGSDLYITSGNWVIRFDPQTATQGATIYSSASQQGFGQVTLRASTGNLLVARARGLLDVLEMTLSGTVVGEYETGFGLNTGQPIGCMELTNGNFLLSTNLGVYRVDSAFTTAELLLGGVQPQYMSLVPDVTLGTNYCTAALNSTGRSATVGASGSEIAANNKLRITAHDLPHGQAGYFLASQTQGFVMNPGGSSGNICLGGAIGRLQSQVMNTSTVGFLHIRVDMSMVPQPMGITAILAGQTWNWQAWYRDVVGMQNTSNFSDAVSVPFN